MNTINRAGILLEMRGFILSRRVIFSAMKQDAFSVPAASAIAMHFDRELD